MDIQGSGIGCGRMKNETDLRSGKRAEKQSVSPEFPCLREYKKDREAGRGSQKMNILSAGEKS